MGDQAALTTPLLQRILTLEWKEKGLETVSEESETE